MLSCLLQEQRLVFFSADWAKLTLVAESLLLYLQVSAGGTLCFLIFLLNLKIIPNFLQHSLIHLSICCLLHLFQPLSWQQPYVPVLSGGMLDFLMAPTAFLMGCHISHFEEVAAVSTNIHCLCSCSIKDKSLCLLAVSKSDLFFWPRWREPRRIFWDFGSRSYLNCYSSILKGGHIIIITEYCVVTWTEMDVLRIKSDCFSSSSWCLPESIKLSALKLTSDLSQALFKLWVCVIQMMWSSWLTCSHTVRNNSCLFSTAFIFIQCVTQARFTYLTVAAC